MPFQEAIDISGQKFVRWSVVRLASTSPRKWLCRCDCGVERTIAAASLRNGHTTSCGCLKKEIAWSHSFRHGMARADDWSPEFRVWSHMRQRCQNPCDKSYARYGGRGISVSLEWERFETFFRDMGPRPSQRHSLDRIDNNKGYCKENCRWATPTQQANNKSNNVFWTINGVTKTAAEWARASGLRHQIVRQRVDRDGWTPERAITTPTLGRGVPRKKQPRIPLPSTGTPRKSALT